MRLGDVISVNPESIRKDYPFCEIEYIDISSVGTGTLQGAQRIQLVDAPSRAKRIVRSGDTLLATVRPNLRSFWFARNPQENTIASTGFAVLRAENGIDERFLYFTVTNQPFTDYLTANAKGAAYPAVDTDIIERAEISLPPLPTQRKIAAVLSAYDDLIENNLRRIKILEEMAQNFYREWFVKFRFPGHEKARFVDSPLGRVPEGWEVVSLLDVADVTYGFAFDSKKFSENKKGIPVVRIRNIIAGYSDTFSEEVPDKKYTVRNGDILVGMDGDFHMGFWTGGNAWLVQRVARFHPKREIGRLHLFLALQQPIRHFNATITGTTVAHLGHKHIKTIKLLWPNKQLLEKISAILNPILDEFINLRLRNKILHSTRDLLLPKLISGEIDVAKLAIRTDGSPKDKNDISRYDFFQQMCRLPFVDKVVLFGSRARGDHHDRSDIDLAVFCDKASDEEWQQVLDCLREDRIDTLLKVDCVRFERSNAALKEHIMIEGEVLYEKNGQQIIEQEKKRKEPIRMSATKLANHLSNSRRCLQRLDAAVRQPLDEDMFMLDAVVHRFNIAFELLMDTLLEYCVESDLLPKERVKEYEINAGKLIGLAFDCKLIDDDQTWIAIKNARNATAHEYDEQQALAHYNKVKSYLPHLQTLFEKMNTI